MPDRSPLAESRKDRLRGGIARVINAAKSESLVPAGRVRTDARAALPHGAAIVRMDREAIDPPLRPSWVPKTVPTKARSFKSSQVSIPRSPELGRRSRFGSPDLRPWVQAAQPEQADHRIVVPQTQSPDVDQDGHSSRDTRCRVGWANRSRGIPRSCSRRRMASTRRTERRQGEEAHTMWASRLGM